MSAEAAKRIADRYIGRDGSEPAPAAHPPGSLGDRISALSKVAAFIAHHDPDDMWGGHRASEAMDALDDLMGFPRGKLRAAVRVG